MAPGQGQADASPECFTCGAGFDLMTRCGGCKQVYFCSHECQRSGWKRHRGDCRRLAGSMAEAEADPQCFTCGTECEVMTRCGGCKQVHFCSHECQRSGWKRHKEDCLRLSACITPPNAMVAPPITPSTFPHGGICRSRSCSDMEGRQSHSEKFGAYPCLKRSHSSKVMPSSQKSRAERPPRSPPRRGTGTKQVRFCIPPRGLNSESKEDHSQSLIEAEDSPRESDLWMLIKDMRSEMAHLTQQREEDRQRNFKLAIRNKTLEGEVERLRATLERTSRGVQEGTEEDDRYLYGTTVRQRAQFWEQRKNLTPEDVR